MTEVCHVCCRHTVWTNSLWWETLSKALHHIMMTSVTRSTSFITQHQTCKTKTKTKTDFWVSDRSCPKTNGLIPLITAQRLDFSLSRYVSIWDFLSLGLEAQSCSKYGFSWKPESWIQAKNSTVRNAYRVIRRMFIHWFFRQAISINIRPALSGSNYIHCGFVCVSVTTITRNCVHRFSPNWVCR